MILFLIFVGLVRIFLVVDCCYSNCVFCLFVVNKNLCILNLCCNNGICSKGFDESFDCMCLKGYFLFLCISKFFFNRKFVLIDLK